MRDRIQRIMNEGSFTPSAFADKLNIGRAVLSHILNGRNKPSLDVVTRILETIPDINSDWLLFGVGNMLKKADNSTIETEQMHNKAYRSDLFDTSIEDHSPAPSKSDDLSAAIDTAQSSEALDKEMQKRENSSVVAEQTPLPPVIKTASKDISKIIIYYTDNTFQAFNPDQTSL